jgi:hypothetical protein
MTDKSDTECGARTTAPAKAAVIKAAGGAQGGAEAGFQDAFRRAATAAAPYPAPTIPQLSLEADPPMMRQRERGVVEAALVILLAIGH